MEQGANATNPTVSGVLLTIAEALTSVAVRLGSVPTDAPSQADVSGMTSGEAQAAPVNEACQMGCCEKMPEPPTVEFGGDEALRYLHRVCQDSIDKARAELDALHDRHHLAQALVKEAEAGALQAEAERRMLEARIGRKEWEVRLARQSQRELRRIADNDLL